MHVLLPLLLLCTSSVVNAHIAMWHEAMFGLNYPYQITDETQKWNSAAVITPLSEQPLDAWFAHGMKGYPPKDGKFLELPTGGSIVAELANSRARTSYRNPNVTTEIGDYVCPDIAPIHIQGVHSFNVSVSAANFGPTALAIAYTSNIDTVQPTDFTVLTTNYTSPWWRKTVYEIPAGLGACGEAGCLCTWNWIHLAGNGAGYGGEIYNVMFRCKVTGATSSNTLKLGGAKVPVKCENTPSNCTIGPKQPMYLWQKAGNNMKESYNTPPTYNERYGFTNGAQKDLFVNGNATITASSTVRTSSASVASNTTLKINPTITTNSTARQASGNVARYDRQ